MSSRAAAWSTMTLDVSGSFLPFASIPSRRSTKNMMSMRWPSSAPGLAVGSLVAGL